MSESNEQASARMLQTPYVLAMLICDTVYRDPGTGKSTIRGCFSSISSFQFPAIHPALTVFAEFTDGRGVVPIRLKIVDVDEERTPVVETECPLY